MFRQWARAGSRIQMRIKCREDPSRSTSPLDVFVSQPANLRRLFFMKLSSLQYSDSTELSPPQAASLLSILLSPTTIELVVLAIFSRSAQTSRRDDSETFQRYTKPKHGMILDQSPVLTFNQNRRIMDSRTHATEQQIHWSGKVPMIVAIVTDLHQLVIGKTELQSRLLRCWMTMCCLQVVGYFEVGFQGHWSIYHTPTMESFDQSSPPLLYLIRSVLLGMAKAAFTVEPIAGQELFAFLVLLADVGVSVSHLGSCSQVRTVRSDYDDHGIAHEVPFAV